MKKCQGNKLEDGKACNAEVLNAKYCKHHLEIIEIMTMIWVYLISIDVNKRINDKNIHLLSTILDYVNSYIGWMKGTSRERPWHYPYSGLDRYRDKFGEKCRGRTLKDGSDCPHNQSKTKNDKGLCDDCFVVERILYRAYHISPEAVYDLIGKNNLFRNISSGTIAYVEYCLRMEYETVCRVSSTNCYGHRERFRSFLGPYIFDTPYPQENVQQTDPNFVLRYAVTALEALDLREPWSHMWFILKGRTHPRDYVKQQAEDSEQCYDREYDDNDSDDDENDDWYKDVAVPATSIINEPEEDWDV